MKTIIFALLLSITTISFAQKQPADHVDPFIGTANGGNTLPGAVVPWGMAYISPHNDSTDKWSGARYFDGQNTFFGFGQNHLSGVGCADFANLVVTPVTGKLRLRPGIFFMKEKAEAGYYATELSNGVKAEVTATRRTTLSKFDFGKEADPYVLINVSKGARPSRDAYVQIDSENEISGYNSSGGFCYTNNSYTIYFVARFSQPFSGYGTWQGDDFYPSSYCEKGTDIGMYVKFNNTGNQPILAKIGISYVSIENARENLEAEQAGWDFAKVRQNAWDKWNQELSKIKVEGRTDEEKTKFYTALYHTLIHPNIINDVNGQYPAMKTKDIAKVYKGHNQYTVFSLWDTYRTLHPLLALVWPDRQTDMVRTMVDMARHGGHLPFWELGADETYVMNGDPAPIVVTDTYFKGLQDFDVDLALETMLETAYKGEGNKMRPMNQYLIKYGYIPWDDCGPDDVWGKPRMVSECLEYTYADWAIAQLAKEKGYKEKTKELEARSMAYKHYFDKEINFIRPKYSNGEWHEPFEPFGPEMKSMPGFVEGNSWQYTFFVPHDIKGLKKMMGGAEIFTQKLQKSFDSSYFTIVNEPDIAYPYLFTHVDGEEWRTAKIVHDIMEEEFNLGPAGLPGNDDAGTISGWYVFSAMGFYPDCPGKPEYRLGSPLFDKVEITLDTDYYPGSRFVIHSNGKEKKGSQKPVKLNGKKFKQYSIPHDKITKGGELEFDVK